MPKAAGALWADCLKSLTTLVDVPFDTPAFSAAADQVFKAMATMSSLPPCKATEWEMIVHKLKVRHAVVLQEACQDALSLHGPLLQQQCSTVDEAWLVRAA